jgi:Tol biopolymer transport system component
VFGTWSYHAGGIYVLSQGGPVVVVIVSGVTVRSIDMVGVDGGSRRALSAGSGDEKPVWSPDGQRIAFVSTRDGRPEIYVAAWDGSGQTRVSRSGKNGSPAWAPDGRRIAFTSSSGTYSQIYVVNSDGTGEAPLTQDSSP